MVDRVSSEKRSFNMSRVRGRGTKPEKLIRSLLHNLGYRFRLHNKKLPGTPDVVLPKYKTVIFVHGCFWHQHEGCRKARRPTSNVEFWNTKLDRNIERDKKTVEGSEELGWKVIIVWQCESKDVEKLSERLVNEL
jgi:DNA mismatch endonuclease (patch repair protein)